MQSGKLAQHRSALDRQPKQDLPAIFEPAFALKQAASLQLVDQCDRRVVLDAQALGDGSDRGPGIPGQAPHGEQQLMLLWFNAGLARGLLAEGEELADLVADAAGDR